MRMGVRGTSRIAAPAVACVAMLLGAADVRAESYADWLGALKREAIERGFEAELVEEALSKATEKASVIQEDRSQPKKPAQFCDYMRKRLSPTRVARGKRMLVEHRRLLAGITADYGVPARYIVALWGLETNFGDYQGDVPIFDALVTLARDERRDSFFRSQIFGALQMIVEGAHPVEGFRGSWAGATGQVQFMPTTFLAYAVDRDGDGRRDLWSSLPDAFASAANYLKRSGWRPGETWGRQVKLSRKLPTRGEKTLREWQALGVRRLDGSALPKANVRAQLVLPTRSGDPVFLGYHNYQMFLAWNRSTFFAISVGTLADTLADRAQFVGCGL